MKYLFVIFGITVGLIQLFLLKKTADSLTAGKKDFLLFVLIKLVVYAGAISLLLLLFRGFILYAGIGLAAGMISGAFINFFITLQKGKNNEKGDDAP